MTKRDTVRYQLKQGNKIIYFGITNDFDRRFSEQTIVPQQPILE